MQSQLSGVSRISKSIYTGACPVRTLLPPCDEVWSSTFLNDRWHRVKGLWGAVFVLWLSLCNYSQASNGWLEALQVSRASSHGKVDVEQKRVMESPRHLSICPQSLPLSVEKPESSLTSTSRSCMYSPSYTEADSWNDTRKHIFQFNQVNQHIVHQRPPLPGIKIWKPGPFTPPQNHSETPSFRQSSRGSLSIRQINCSLSSLFV